MGAGLTTTGIYAAETLPNGEIIVSGDAIEFDDVLGETHLATWDGNRWRGVPNGPHYGDVQALVLTPQGDLIAGGNFSSSTAGCGKLARWNGRVWSCIGDPGAGGGTVGALAVTLGGDVIVGGGILGYIKRWNGSSWSLIPNGMDSVPFDFALMPDGDLVAGGFFTQAGGVTVNYIARLHVATGSWSSLNGGMDQQAVTVLKVLPDGDLLAGGGFAVAGGVPASRIARWDGQAWHALEAGVDGGWVSAIAVLPGGDIAVAGTFTSAGGQPANYVAAYVMNPRAPTATLSVSRAVACDNSATALSVASLGTEPLTFGWEVETGPDVWAVIGPGGVDLACGGQVSAAPFNGRPTSITIRRCGGVAGGGTFRVRAVVSNPCGMARSEPGVITVNSADFDNDGDSGTDVDIAAFFACLGGACCPTCGSADFNGDGDVGTDADIESFFRVLGGGSC